MESAKLDIIDDYIAIGAIPETMVTLDNSEVSSSSCVL